MRYAHFERFRPLCPVCLGRRAEQHRLILAVVRSETAEEVIDGILHCSNPACQHEYPILDGIPVIVPDLARLLTEHGVEILLRDDIDPVLESLLGDALGPDSWFNAARQTISTYAWDGYADLAPEAASDDAPRPGAARRCLDRLLALSGPVAADRILDLGCAAGRTAFALAETFPQAHVLGIDLHLALLRLARRAGRGTVSYAERRIGVVYDRRSFPVEFAGAARVDFWACDASVLPFAAGSVDLVLALNLLDCVAEPRRLVADLSGLLRIGGSLLLATPYDWSTRATPVETWIGGHSQRGNHDGAGEAFLRILLDPAGHPQSVPGLRIVGEAPRFPWHTRIHERGWMQYLTHLVALARNDG